MYSRPTLASLVQRINTDVLSRLATDDALRRNDAAVYATAMAGAVHGLYGYIDWVSRQVIYDTADDDMLLRWASIWGVPQKSAAPATGFATFTISTGAAVPSGTLLQALDGVQYLTTADATLSGTTATAPITAVASAAAGNRAAGQSMSLVSPIVGVQPQATAGLLSGGADVESIDSVKARLLSRIQQPPQGGTLEDYQTWALSVPGVTRVWVSPKEMGDGTITVRFVRDNDGNGAAIIPDANEVAAVQAALDVKRPAGLKGLYVVAPVAVPLNFTISGLMPATTSVQLAVQAELADLLLRESVPGGTLLLSHIRAAISVAAGEVDSVLVSPSANVVNPTGTMSIMGAITWL